MARGRCRIAMHGGFEAPDCRFSTYFPEETLPKAVLLRAPADPGSEPRGHRNLRRLHRVRDLAVAGTWSSRTSGRFRRALRGEDSTVAGYRQPAVAIYSRARRGDVRRSTAHTATVFGGSGGAIRTMVCIERARRVGRRRALHPRHADEHAKHVLGAGAALWCCTTRSTQIADAVEPGGGDMFARERRGARR